jgi:GMP synthase-like glutamine amidotransferase
MRPVLIFRHGAAIPPGHLGRVLAAEGFATMVLPLDEGAPIPDHLDWSGVVSLGGEMGAYQEADHPWLAAEKEFLTRAVEAEVPVLGICLGVQMLADTLGGKALTGERGIEAGVMTVNLTPAGRGDPVVSQLDGPVPVWHGDTFELPPGATLLAQTERYPHAFRFGSAVGVQSHPEATAEIVTRWTKLPAAADQLASAGIDRHELLAAIRDAEPETTDVANRLFGAWASSLASG